MPTNKHTHHFAFILIITATSLFLQSCGDDSTPASLTQLYADTTADYFVNHWNSY